MDFGLSGRVALVTGAGSGIGRKVVEILLREGCQIVAADIRIDPDDWSTPGGAIHSVEGDITRETDVQDMVQQALAVFGRLDILVCSAGVYETHSAMELEMPEWERTLDVNLRGPYLCARAAFPAMSEAGWGRILLISSAAALTGGLAAGPAYVSSKAGIMGLTRSLANHFGPAGITVNCVNPGVIETPMTEVLERNETAQRTPLRRNGTATEVASMICMLASEQAGFVTGAHLSINGGLVPD